MILSTGQAYGTLGALWRAEYLEWHQQRALNFSTATDGFDTNALP